MWVKMSITIYLNPFITGCLSTALYHFTYLKCRISKIFSLCELVVMDCKILASTHFYFISSAWSTSVEKFKTAKLIKDLGQTAHGPSVAC